MRKYFLVPTLAALFGAGLLGASLLPATSQQATTIKVYEKAQSGFNKYVNVAPKRKVSGDYLVLRVPLYRVGTNDKVGSYSAQLTFVQGIGKEGNARFRAAATFSLRRGKIEASGASTFGHLRNGALFSITGGTQAFAGATGTLRVREAKGRTVFTLTLNQ